MNARIDQTSDAAELARQLLVRSELESTRAERRRTRRLGRVVSDQGGRDLVFALTDRVMRAASPARAIDLLRELEVPPGLGSIDRVGLRLAARAGTVAPGLVSRVVRRRILADTRGVILPAGEPGFSRYVRRRHDEGVIVNLNVLGEAILGDGEAAERVESVCRYLRRPDVTYVSIKVSALCANLDVLAFEASVERASEQLRRIYRVARDRMPRAFVNLDMEEYRDLHLTVAVFRRVLDEPELRDLAAGIALQAYVPDSYGVLVDLCEWAARRRDAGAAQVKVRLVKGANLAMEATEAELAGWPQAPYPTKEDVDANYKRMLDTALAEPAVRVGVASHNLFDVAWALVQRDRLGAADRVDIEMLEGMAPAQSRAVQRKAGGLIAYAPVVANEDFPAAIAYLARRLDENSAPDNFLRALFTLTPDSRTWNAQQARFEAAAAARSTVPDAPRRTQDRASERITTDPGAPFANAPDTDFALAANRAWIERELASHRPVTVPPIATAADVDLCVARARAAASRWATTAPADRRAALHRAADVMAAARGRTIAVMAGETAKTVREGDPEVSEGVDMARWIAGLVDSLGDARPLGVVVVAGPWNFPYAIPANGVLSAVAAGNAAILKPAPEAVATAVELVRQIHDAGIPEDVVQLLNCADDDAGRRLITHGGVDTVLLTGSYETAQLFLGWKPSLRLIAETSGKNAIVVTGAADVDLAIRDLVRSAFGHAGQKCSAASLAVLTADIYDDRRVLDRLADAVRSIRVGPAADFSTMMGPIIRPPGAALRRGLTELDDGESWLVRPTCLDGETMWSPGVRFGVRPGSWFHQTECFGPVLGVMRAADLDEAIAIQNSTVFGLTGGIHSLDEREVTTWLARVEVGNAYVNRHITGAIVRRQPFGGWKRSSVGPGAKTGGHGDLLRLVRPVATGGGDDFDAWWRRRFGAEEDATGLRAERNALRYRPVRKVVARAAAADVALLRRAAAVTRVPLDVSLVGDEDEQVLADRLLTSGAERLRVLVPAGDGLLVAAHRAGLTVDTTPLTGDGQFELPRWLREQAVSQTTHRHGRVTVGPVTAPASR